VPYEGSLRLGRVELTGWRGDVRRVIGLVEQDPHLFDPTVRENLLLAQRDADDDALEPPSLRRCSSGSTSCPTASTPRSASTARDVGGERQRLAVARALLCGFPLSSSTSPPST
jgi:ABC-type transport system involved in cytochrome bd biosynthesis fused ATPase/permease subunit